MINLSVGRHGGPHDGMHARRARARLPRAGGSRPVHRPERGQLLRLAAPTPAAASSRPASGRSLSSPIAADITPNELEIWYSGSDELAVRIESPAGQPDALGAARRAGRRRRGRPSRRAHLPPRRDPNNSDNHIDLFLYPDRAGGGWNVTLQACAASATATFHAWLERDEAARTARRVSSPPTSTAPRTTGTIANGHLAARRRRLRRPLAYPAARALQQRRPDTGRSAKARPGRARSAGAGRPIGAAWQRPQPRTADHASPGRAWPRRT